jgi:uncharacterized protein (TIGR02271 family)
VSGSDEEASVVRHEEEFRIGKRLEELGVLRLKTEVSTETVEGDFDIESEDADVTRIPVESEDSGQIETLSDGSVSIPLFEEQLVVSRRLVVRERIIVRKHTTARTEHVRGEVRREHVDVARLEPSDEETAKG